MASQDMPPRRPGTPRFTRWSRDPSRPAKRGFNRQMVRLISIPVLAVAGVVLYQGLRDRFFLPECGSSRATSTLADVLKQLDIAPLRLAPIKTVSTSKTEVVCNAALPLANGETVNVDYSFFWQGDKANMRYSISHKPPEDPAPSPPREG
jgi:hypothetical protein